MRNKTGKPPHKPSLKPISSASFLENQHAIAWFTVVFGSSLFLPAVVIFGLSLQLSVKQDAAAILPGLLLLAFQTSVVLVLTSFRLLFPHISVLQNLGNLPPHRSHTVHFRHDHLNRAWQRNRMSCWLEVLLLSIYCFATAPFDALTIFLSSLSPWANKIRLKSQPRSFTIWINGVHPIKSVPLVVTGETTMLQVGLMLFKLKLLPTNFIEEMTAWTCNQTVISQRVSWFDTMNEHGMGSLSWIQISMPILGGSSEATEMNIEGDSAGLAGSSSRRPHKQTQQYLDAIDDAKTSSHTERAGEKWKRRRRKPIPADPDDEGSSFSDGSSESSLDNSEEDVHITNEERAESLQTKTNPTREKRRGSTGKQRAKKKSLTEEAPANVMPAENAQPVEKQKVGICTSAHIFCKDWVRLVGVWGNRIVTPYLRKLFFSSYLHVVRFLAE
ncbi:hypothetical protein DL96DRAFT_1250079 [Flagelloscypha sp. PMI_526]|nr:hypothetical protein DL96DRAFT_1250079 [Flagelloscypha sp. PMI_526]